MGSWADGWEFDCWVVLRSVIFVRMGGRRESVEMFKERRAWYCCAIEACYDDFGGKSQHHSFSFGDTAALTYKIQKLWKNDKKLDIFLVYSC